MASISRSVLLKHSTKPSAKGGTVVFSSYPRLEVCTLLQSPAIQSSFPGQSEAAWEWSTGKRICLSVFLP